MVCLVSLATLLKWCCAFLKIQKSLYCKIEIGEDGGTMYDGVQERGQSVPL